MKDCVLTVSFYFASIMLQFCLTISGSAEIPVCGSKSLNCMNIAEDELSIREFNQSIETSKENYRGPTSCNCLPACTSIAYEAEISQADYDHHLTMKMNQQDADSTENDSVE